MNVFKNSRSFNYLCKTCWFSNTSRFQNVAVLKRLKSHLIDGKKAAQEIQTQLRDDIEKWSTKNNRQPTLAAVLVGDNPASLKYIQKKMEAAKFVGIKSWTETLSDGITEDDLIKKVEELNCNSSVDGILVQLPVPEHISETKVCQAVVPKKDVDGFHMMNMGKLCLNIDTFVPCTVLAVIELLKKYDIPTFGKNVVICGRSKYIGLPLAIILNSDAKHELPGMEATVTLCHRNTPPEQLKMFTQSADIVISATGIIGLIKPDMIKKGACVIDIGTNRITTEEGKVRLVGDVDFEGVQEVADHITPVPGGVGPMTVTMLMKNTFKAAVNRGAI